MFERAFQVDPWTGMSVSTASVKLAVAVAVYGDGENVWPARFCHNVC